MLNIIHLVYPGRFTNSELVTFIKTSSDYTTAFINANTDDRPVIEMQSFDASGLSSFNNDLINKYNTYRKVLEIPRKHINSDQILIQNTIRIKIVGDTKKVIKLAYDNTKSEGSEIIWNLIRDYKNLRKKKMDDVTGEITKLLDALDTDTNKAYYTEIKVSNLIVKLKEANDKFETLYKDRDVYEVSNKKKSSISKKECIASFYTMVEYINSSIIATNTTNYDDLVVKLNSIIEPYNKNARSKKKTKKDDDRPVITFAKKKKVKVENDPEKKEM